MKTRVKDYLTQAELLCQLAEESAGSAQRAPDADERQPNADFICLSELLEIRDWEEVANIREQKENRWLRRLSEK